MSELRGWRVGLAGLALIGLLAVPGQVSAQSSPEDMARRVKKAYEARRKAIKKAYEAQKKALERQAKARIKAAEKDFKAQMTRIKEWAKRSGKDGRRDTREGDRRPQTDRAMPPQALRRVGRAIGELNKRIERLEAEVKRLKAQLRGHDGRPPMKSRPHTDRRPHHPHTDRRPHSDRPHTERRVMPFRRTPARPAPNSSPEYKRLMKLREKLMKDGFNEKTFKKVVDSYRKLMEKQLRDQGGRMTPEMEKRLKGMAEQWRKRLAPNARPERGPRGRRGAERPDMRRLKELRNRLMKDGFNEETFKDLIEAYRKAMGGDSMSPEMGRRLKEMAETMRRRLQQRGERDDRPERGARERRERRERDARRDRDDDRRERRGRRGRGGRRGDMRLY